MSWYQKKNSPTHHPDHHPIFISSFHLLWSIAYSVSNCVLCNLFAQPLSMSSLVYLLVWSPPPHISCISSPNQCLLFATHAHTTTTCFAVVSILYNLFLVFQLLTWHSVFHPNITHPSDHSHLCSMKCQLIFTVRRNARIASAVLASAIPSVCLSVTLRYCVKKTARSTVQFALSDSKTCLVL